jgi:hypothetical protein
MVNQLNVVECCTVRWYKKVLSYSMSEENHRTMIPYFTVYTYLLLMIKQTYDGIEIGA